MNIIKPSINIETSIDGLAIVKKLEKIARVCYKSEDKITENSWEPFLRKIVMTNHHESILEHESITVTFTVDRGVSHELVRHKLNCVAI